MPRLPVNLANAFRVWTPCPLLSVKSRLVLLATPLTEVHEHVVGISVLAVDAEKGFPDRLRYSTQEATMATPYSTRIRRAASGPARR